VKSDLDALMQARGFDAILVLGDTRHNAPMYYLTGGGHVSDATLIKKRGDEAVLFHKDMERDEAAKSGLKTIPYSRYPPKELLQQAEGDAALAAALRLQRMFADLGVAAGRVGVYGHTDLGHAFAVLTHLQRLAPDLTIIGEPGTDSLFMRAMETKDEAEVARIRAMGRITTEVVGMTADFLTSHPVGADETLRKADGSPLTIGDVKARIDLWLAERGVENPEGTIFAIGRDAGVPHSAGNPADPIRLGRTIIFDIFPCEAGGGYFYDFTRTWCLGYAPEDVRQLYDQVRAVYEEVVQSLEPNASFKDYQRLACERFEAQGHPTPLNTEAPIRGYVHSLGHGLGVNVHERPWSKLQYPDDNPLAPGVVFTIEPGLYYPEKGMGVRLENTYWARPDGRFEALAEYPLDLVLPMKG